MSSRWIPRPPPARRPGAEDADQAADASPAPDAPPLLLAQATTTPQGIGGIEFLAPEVITTPDPSAAKPEPKPEIVVPESSWTRYFVGAGAGLALLAGVQSQKSQEDKAPQDLTPPSATVTDDIADEVTNRDSISFTVTFSEPVKDFAADDLRVGNGTVAAFAASGTGRTTFTIQVRPTALLSGDVTVDIAAGAASDDANNASLLVARVRQTVDLVPPTIHIAIADRVLTAGQSSLVTFTFSEPVSGGGIADLSAENATLSGWSSSDGGLTWTSVLTPFDYITDSTNVVTLDSTSIVDRAGNALSGRHESNNYLVDTASLNLAEISRVASGNGGFVVNGQAGIEWSGLSANGVGDLNGDGLDDLALGAPYGGDGGNGRAYVVFGRTGLGSLELSTLAADHAGWVIVGESPGDLAGWSLTSAGDIDGDGLGDLLIGAKWANPASGNDAGRTYVVYGRSAAGTIELSAVAAGQGGFAIDGHCTSDWSGTRVAPAGDVNGDGLADLLIGAPGADPAGKSAAGRSYVVFGATDLSTVDLSAVTAGIGGFVVNGHCRLEQSGGTLAGAGDVNGDGLTDLLIGASRASANGQTQAGRAYVVFGRTATDAVELSAVAGGQGGFVINGQCANDYAGRSVAAAGDVNGDGLADLLVGAPTADVGALVDAGRGYVVFGRAATVAVNLSAVAGGQGGFVINGQCATDQAGAALQTAGDIDGDGLADLLIGAPTSDPSAGIDGGRAYLVAGQTGGDAVNLSLVASGVGGFVINGHCQNDLSGSALSTAGDVNGDGLTDMLVTAPFGDPDDYRDAGRSYVLFGDIIGPFRRTTVDNVPGGGNDALNGGPGNENYAAGGGNDALLMRGGNHVLSGGGGDDRFTLDAEALRALLAGPASGNYARIDGGAGIDTLAIGDAGVTLDLRAIANQGGALPGSLSRLESIERIDLTGTGNNSLLIDYRDVVDMAGMNRFTNATGWTDGSYDLAAGGTAAPERRHQLVIDGDAGDTLQTAGGFRGAAGTVAFGGNLYQVFNHPGAFVQLLVDTDIRATIL